MYSELSMNSLSLRIDQLRTRRQFWLKIHLYLGLFAGAILVLIGLTGSILVFWQEIDGWLNPQLIEVKTPVSSEIEYRPLTEIVEAAKNAVSTRSTSLLILYPNDENKPFWFTFYGSDDKADTVNVFIDPYTAKVIGTRIWYHATNPLKHSLMGFIFKLHHSLLINENGLIIVGIVGVFLTISVLTGLIVWWPLTGKWRQALTIKRSLSVKRLNYDIHKTFGFYSTLVLMALLVSGIYFNLPEQFVWLVERFSPVSKPKQFMSTPQNQSPVTIDRALNIVRERYPNEKFYWFSTPNGERGSFVFTLHQQVAGLFTGRHQVVLDQYSGATLADLSPSSGSSGQMFIQWQWSLHSGHALGMPGRILVLLAGLACAVLYVTGVIRWLQKRRAKAQNQDRRLG